MKDGIDYIKRRYLDFVQKHGYIPILFAVYSASEIIDIHPTITTQTALSFTKSGTVLIIERDRKN